MNEKSIMNLIKVAIISIIIIISVLSIYKSSKCGRNEECYTYKESVNKICNEVGLDWYELKGKRCRNETNYKVMEIECEEDDIKGYICKELNEI